MPEVDDETEPEMEDQNNVSVVAVGHSTRVLVDQARRAGNIQSSSRGKSKEKSREKSKNKSKEKSGERSSDKSKNSTPTSAKRVRQADEEEEEEEVETCTVQTSRARLGNSAIFPKKDRPDWLMEDEDIDTLPRATVANVIAQFKMTQAIEKQNKLKEDKVVRSKGGISTDQEVKTMKVEEGEDNATTKLHSLRFKFRTPLLKPETYWDSFPVKWPETNKRIHLTHLGLDHVVSAKTKEMVHDRSDPTISIKMFSNINIMVGREGTVQTSRVQQHRDYIEVESRDNWLDMTSVAQLEEALDNLVRLWGSMWPGDYGPSNLRGVVTKHRSFNHTFDHQETRKKVLEDFVNRILVDNAVRAGQKLPPLSYKEVDDRAKDLIERKADFNKGKNQNLNQNFNNQNQTKNRMSGRFSGREANKPPTSEFVRLQTFLKGFKNGRDVCVWFNLKEKCQTSNCPRKHVSAKLPTGKKELCLEKHGMQDCKK